MARFININAHYLSGSSFHNFIRILIRNKFSISVKYFPRTLILVLATLSFYPFYLIEKLIFSRRIKKTKLKQAPVFIIGHWRSGTTYMHNLICQNNTLCFPTTYQCFMPGTFLSGGRFLKTILSALLPEKRPMDNVKLNADYPQEDEFAINALCPFSFYEALCFPSKTKKYFQEFALLDSKEFHDWKKYYKFFFQKIAYINGNKQIISKNPANTVRIKILLELYPGAKFIYMKRNKEQVLNSTFNLYQKFLSLYSLQSFSKKEIEENLVWLYNNTINAYEEQKSLVPKNNLIEINYQDLIENPLREIECIYNHLHIQGFNETRSALIKYIDSQRSYKPNTEQFMSNPVS